MMGEGPKDPLGERVERASEWYQQQDNRRLGLYALVGIIALWGYAALQGTPLPKLIESINSAVPPEVYAAGGLFVVTSVVWYPAGKKIYSWIWEPNGVFLLALDPKGTDHALKYMSPLDYERLTVIDHATGAEVPKSYLHDVRVEGKKAVEVMAYDEDRHVAFTTWMGDSTPAELRTYRGKVDRVITDLSKQADEAVRLRGSIRPIVTEAMRIGMEEMIAATERRTVPNGDEIDSYVDAAMERTGMEIATDIDLDGDGDGGGGDGQDPERPPAEGDARQIIIEGVENDE
jgi:hypothetical protein